MLRQRFCRNQVANIFASKVLNHQALGYKSARVGKDSGSNTAPPPIFTPFGDDLPSEKLQRVGGAVSENIFENSQLNKVTVQPNATDDSESEVTALALAVIVCFKVLKAAHVEKDVAQENKDTVFNAVAAAVDAVAAARLSAVEGIAAANKRHTSAVDGVAAANNRHTSAVDAVAAARLSAVEGVAAANERLTGSKKAVATVRLTIECLEAVIEHGRNLNDTEYDAILPKFSGGVNVGFVRKITTIHEYTDEKAKEELRQAEAKLEAKLHQAKEELHQAKEELHQAKEELHQAKEELHQTKEELRQAKEELHQAKEELRQAEAKLEAKLHQAKEELRQAKEVKANTEGMLEENLRKAHENLETPSTKFDEADRKLKNFISKLCEKSDEYIDVFLKADVTTGTLTKHLPFGMLGREECVTKIKGRTLEPADKYPPIMIISTSRAGKSLLLDTLKKQLNSDGTGSVFVVTCSLNGAQVIPDEFSGSICTSYNAERFVLFVLNLLLLGSIGKRPTSAKWKTLVSLDSTKLCSLIREKHKLDPKTKLLLAVDELTTIFDKFDSDSRNYIVTKLGTLSNEDSQLLVTGFTVNAENAFLGVSKRSPALVKLNAIDAKSRYQYIPLMTAMLWVIKTHMGVGVTTQRFTYFYCVAHEVLKSCPGLMGAVVDVLTTSDLDNMLEVKLPKLSMWDVVEKLSNLLPDRDYFKGELLTGGLSTLNKYLTTESDEEKKRCLGKLMSLNMAAPSRLDAFRILMCFMKWKRLNIPGALAPFITVQGDIPAVAVLYEFMDHYNNLYARALSNDTPNTFKNAKGKFFEVACGYGLRLLWIQMKSGRDCPVPLLVDHVDQSFLEDLKVKSFHSHFPVSAKLMPVNMDAEMFEPNTLLYPKAQKGKPENNPLVDLVLNMSTKDGIVQVWVQVKHTLNIKPLPVSTLRNAMLTISKYNDHATRSGLDQVVKVLFFVVGPDRLKVTIDHGAGKDIEVISNSTKWTAPLAPITTPLVLRCITSLEERESLLGDFINQMVPDYESHDSPFEVSLEKKVDTMSALNRDKVNKNIFDEEFDKKREALALSEGLFFEDARKFKRFDTVNLPKEVAYS